MQDSDNSASFNETHESRPGTPASEPEATPELSGPARLRRQFGNALRKIRKLRGLTIYELAEKAGVDAGYISRLENAHRNPPSPRVLQRFAEALSIRADMLMMAAGYLEFDPTGKPLGEEEIIRRIESELTSGKREPVNVESESTTETRRGIEDILRQLDEMKKGLLDAIKEGPTHDLPILGKIPAGFPVGAEEYAVGRLPVEKTGLPNDPNLFALRVSGDSLRDIGILDGDYVVISPMLKNALDQGSVCAVRLDDDDVALKRVYFTENSVILRSANPAYPDIIKQTVRIIGKVVRLIRQF